MLMICCEVDHFGTMHQLSWTWLREALWVYFAPDLLQRYFGVALAIFEYSPVPGNNQLMYQYVGVLLTTATVFRSECVNFQYYGVFEDEDLYVSYPVCHRVVYYVDHVPRCTSGTPTPDQPIWVY